MTNKTKEVLNLFILRNLADKVINRKKGEDMEQVTKVAEAMKRINKTIIEKLSAEMKIARQRHSSLNVKKEYFNIQDKNSPLYRLTLKILESNKESSVARKKLRKESELLKEISKFQGLKKINIPKLSAPIKKKPKTSI